MNKIHPDKLKQHLKEKLNYFYIFLGEDIFLIQKNQSLILNIAYKKGFLETVKIDIEKNKDWEKIILFYKNKKLFFKKTILVVNLIIKKLNVILIKNINKISYLLNSDILMILKFNHLSIVLEKNKLLSQLISYGNIVSCVAPNNMHYINWIKHEIKEKNINIDDKAFFLLSQYYEGNTLFISNVLDILLITWPNTSITVKKIKQTIIDCFSFYPLHWINSIFLGQIKKAIYILNIFFEQKYNPLFLIRYLQQDLIKLIYIKREKKININTFFKKNNILNKRSKFFISAFERINYHSLFKAIQIISNIEINIKKNYNNSVWNQLRELTLILC